MHSPSLPPSPVAVPTPHQHSYIHPQPPALLPPETRNPRHVARLAQAVTTTATTTTTSTNTAALRTADLDSTASSSSSTSSQHGLFQKTAKHSADIDNHDDGDDDNSGDTTRRLRRLIHAYADMDLHSNDDAFQAWVAHKLTTTTHGRGDSLSAPPPKPLSLPTTAAKYKDPNAAFRAWKQSKTRAAAVKKQTQLSISDPTSSTTHNNPRSALSSPERTKLELTLWARGKRVHAQRAQMNAAAKAKQQEWQAGVRARAARKAYRCWVARKDADRLQAAAECSTQHQHLHHTREWVNDTADADDKGDKVANPASPPSMFRDYPRCASVAPQYLRRYRVQVASAGAETNDPDEKIKGRRNHRAAAVATTPPVLTKRGGPWIAVGGYGHM
ncbi:hypothetical protein HDU86_000521 [Geranomyces michiganensis]|nr:hypothetical protein HDU86_000521 [Geranomyces michiganensis]